MNAVVYLVDTNRIVLQSGLAALRSYIFAKLETSEILDQIASSFPAAAPYFAGYLLYQTALQSFLEMLRLGLPLIAYVFSRRSAISPRQRLEGQRTASFFLFLPNGLFALAIALEFSIFNPLVLPFALVYFVVARSKLFVHSDCVDVKC